MMSQRSNRMAATIIKRWIVLGISCLAIAIIALSSPVLAQRAGPFHPMDALTVREINEAVRALRTAGHVDASTRFADVRLVEMAKPQMLAWRRGMAFSRTALVIARHKGKTFEAIVDLTAGKIKSITAKPGAQPSIMQEEWDLAQRLTKADTRWRAAMRKRGHKTFNNIHCAPIAAGYFGDKKYLGKRLMVVPCNVSHPPTKDRIEQLYRIYGIPVEGVHAVVDIDARKVLDIIDTGPVVTPNVTGKPISSSLASTAKPIKPVLLLAPQGVNYRLSGGIMVEWQKWSFHVRAERRTGPVISLVRYRDGGRNRLIAYQMALSEMFVPYMDPSQTWVHRSYLDAGEYGIGYLASSLAPGRDCPLQSSYISVFIPSDKGSVFRVKRAICIFERNQGDPLWRHENIASGKTQSRARVELVVRMATVVGNYDYLIDWVFDQNGNIKGRIGASGIVAVKSTPKASAAAPAGQLKGVQSRDYGTLVSPNMIAVYHDHYFSFRLDLDIEGQANSLVRERLVPTLLAKSNKRRSIWQLEQSTMKHEGPVRPPKGGREIWRIINPHGRTALGHAPSYHIMPGLSATSLLSPDDFPQKRAAFSAEKLWVTAFKPHEKYASGAYPNQHPGGDGLPVYISDKQAIESKDIVLWYTMGFHHVTRAEDWPIMPTMWHEFTLRPFNFFDENPSINVAPGFVQRVRQAPAKRSVAPKKKP